MCVCFRKKGKILLLLLSVCHEFISWATSVIIVAVAIAIAVVDAVAAATAFVIVVSSVASSRFFSIVSFPCTFYSLCISSLSVSVFICVCVITTDIFGGAEHAVWFTQQEPPKEAQTTNTKKCPPAAAAAVLFQPFFHHHSDVFWLWKWWKNERKLRDRLQCRIVSTAMILSQSECHSKWSQIYVLRSHSRSLSVW